MGNSFGKLFKLSSWGESHGKAIGVVVDGCPPNIELDANCIQAELNRRAPAKNTAGTQRAEADCVQVLSGLHQGRSLGTPIAMLVANTDALPKDYKNLESCFRPSHADYTYFAKFGREQPSGGGRASARETLARVAAGAIAKRALHQISSGSVELRAFTKSIHELRMPDLDIFPSLEMVEASPTRCPHPELAAKMLACIEAARQSGDSLGGVIECRVRGLPAGLGNPVFDRLEANLAKAMLSLPASKGFEIGSGFAGAAMRGSEHNDAFEMREGQLRTRSNHSGGVQGGISNGEELVFRVAFKPTASIAKEQDTVDTQGRERRLRIEGRHDPCVLPRAVVIVEAMAALVLMDAWMLHTAQCGLEKNAPQKPETRKT